MWKIVGSEIVALGLTTPRLWSALAGLVVMVLVDLVAVHSMGIAGAALGSACGYAVAAVVVFKAWSTRANRSTKSLLGLTACSEGVR
jgi:Na+-driven multidrug efflux pump